MSEFFTFKDVPIFKKLSLANEDKNRYFMYVNILNFADPTILKDWFNTNPRNQDDAKKKNVYKEIRETLESDLENFQIKNKGILFFAESCEFNNAKNEVTISFENPEIHGNVDGGHTLKIIHDFLWEAIIPDIMNNKNITFYDTNSSEERSNNYLEMKKRLLPYDFDLHKGYVLVEVMTNIPEEDVSEIAKTRNSSIQVDDKSLDNLKGKYDLLKESLKNNPKNYENWDLFNRLRIEQGSDIDYPIDINKLTSLIEFFICDNCSSTLLYNGHKKLSLNFIKRIDGLSDNGDFRNSKVGSFIKSIEEVMWTIFELYDYIEVKFPDIVNKGDGEKKCRYGSKSFTKGRGYAFFSKTEMKDKKVPDSLIKPIVGAFKVLIAHDENQNKYYFKENPIRLLKEDNDKIHKELVQEVWDALNKDYKNNPNRLGKDDRVYKHCSDILQKYYR